MKNKRTEKIILVGAVILLVAGVVLMIVYFNKDGGGDNPILNNATIEGDEGVTINIWFHDTEKLNSFKERGIKYLFVDIGNTGQDGNIETDAVEIETFLDFIEDYSNKENYYFIILPYSEVILKDYDFSEDFQKNFISDYESLSMWGFDGVHVDVEAIPENKKQAYLNLIDELRTNLGENKVLSVYAGAIKENPDEDWDWSPEFYKAVGNKVDIVTTQGYDFDLKTKEEYQDYLKKQFEDISNLNINTKLFFTIPTHNPAPETIENALEVYSKFSEEPNNFDGVVIFAEWTTSDSEWQTYDSYVK